MDELQLVSLMAMIAHQHALGRGETPTLQQSVKQAYGMYKVVLSLEGKGRESGLDEKLR